MLDNTELTHALPPLTELEYALLREACSAEQNKSMSEACRRPSEENVRWNNHWNALWIKLYNHHNTDGSPTQRRINMSDTIYCVQVMATPGEIDSYHYAEGEKKMLDLFCALHNAG